MEPEHDLPAPPRALLWLAVGLFALIIVVAIGALIFYTSGGRLRTLLPYVLVVAGLTVVATYAIGILNRKRLPRLFLLWTTICFVILGALAGVGGVWAFSNMLPPRYQVELTTPFPFLSSFLPPTPQGGTVPTVAPAAGGLSPEDLLNMSIGGEATDEPAPTATVQATTTPTQAATMTPMPTETQVATATLVPASATPLAPATEAALVPTAASVISRPASARMYGFTHVQQDWNNCGPANVTMALSHFGWRESQEFAASLLKPNEEDKNVSPSEIVNFINTQTGVRAAVRIGGDINLMRDLIAANFPVIMETAYTPEGYDWIGHYRTVVGYDDIQGVFYVYDSFLGAGEGGAGLAVPYREFDQGWQAFNRVFIVLYEQDRESLVVQLLGERATVAGAAEYALRMAQEEARTNPQDVFAWFNIGTAYTELGLYEEAAAAYDISNRLGMPFRILWYQFGPFEAYFNVGRYGDVIALVNTNMTNSQNRIEEAFYWRGRVLAAQGNAQEAQAAFRQALSLNPRFGAAQEALTTLG